MRGSNAPYFSGFIMRVKALRNFSGARWGNVSIGQVLEISEHLARQMIADDLVAGLEIPEKKFFCETTAQLSSEVGQVSQKISAGSLIKQGQKASAALSPSTPALKPATLTQSTDAIEPGGKDTATKRRGRPKSSQPTNGQPKNTV